MERAASFRRTYRNIHEGSVIGLSIVSSPPFGGATSQLLNDSLVWLDGLSSLEWIVKKCPDAMN